VMLGARSLLGGFVIWGAQPAADAAKHRPI
jgi:hypothetical protein